jgi:hypothetical protein
MMSEKLAVAVVATARATAAVLTRTQPAATAATTVTVRAGGFSGNRANGKRAKTDGNATADAATTATTAATATEAANAAVTESPATATEATRTTTTEPTATATLCKLNALASRLTTDLRQRERAARRCHRRRRRHPHLSGVRRRRNEADGPGCNRNHFESGHISLSFGRGPDGPVHATKTKPTDLRWPRRRLSPY